MAVLPVIVGFGGVNAAGRSSGFHGYKRMIHEVLSDQEMQATWLDLAHRMKMGNLDNGFVDQIKSGTLIRRIHAFDPEQVPTHIKVQGSSPTVFHLKRTKLPYPIPSDWHVQSLDDQFVRVTLPEQSDFLVQASRALPVSCAGSLPQGFNPGDLYHSHHHPRALSLAIYGASDALHMLGIDWDTVLSEVAPDAISVYAGSALAQVDENSYVGLIAEPLRGNRVNSKMMPLSLPEMPADFINSYVLNSVGQTGTQVGACASFLYNLKQGILDIQTGRAKVALVGNADAPLVPAIIDGFAAMGALATDDSLKALDRVSEIDYKRACRPFSTNTGFTLAEGAQFVILMEDALAIKLGAPIYGAVADVYINADGNKKSIAKPGIGNYLTFAKATALAKSILGQTELEKTVVFAHGTGTPQNRVTESHLINYTAQVFNIPAWPVAAVKAYVGHTIGAAAGDQLIAALGIWKYGYVPGIKSIDHIAEDVHQSHLNILLDHLFVGDAGKDCPAVLLNSKGFGGNNATALILSPYKAKSILHKKLGDAWEKQYLKKNEEVMRRIKNDDQQACSGKENVYYTFGTQVMEESDVKMTATAIKLSQFQQEVALPTENPY